MIVDRLARNALLAKQAGMSYGRWKAMQHIVPVEKKAESQEGWKACEACKEPFKPFSVNQRFCCSDCQKAAYAEKQKELQRVYQRNYRERRKATATSGTI